MPTTEPICKRLEFVFPTLWIQELKEISVRSSAGNETEIWMISWQSVYKVEKLCKEMTTTHTSTNNKPWAVGEPISRITTL